MTFKFNRRFRRVGLGTGAPGLGAVAAIGLILLNAAACSDSDGSNGGSGGSRTKGTGGNAGSPSGGAKNGSGGDTIATAGVAGIGGNATSNGGAAGAITSVGSAGSAGTTSVTEYWEDGVTGAPLDPNYDDRLWGVAFGKAGEIYAAGSITSATGDRQMVVAKFDSKAALDASFGNGGIVSVNLSTYLGSPDDPATTASDPDASVEEARALVVQSDGKIVVVGRAEDPHEAAPSRSTLADLVFFRLNTDGSLDKSFGNPSHDGTALDGYAVVNLGDLPEDQVWGLDIDANDRVYAFASGRTADPTRTDADRYVVRLTANGTLDSTFGNGGLASFDLPQGSLTGTAPVTLKLNDNPRHGSVLPDGSVIASGYTSVAGRNQVVMAKFTKDGVLDTTFSGDGVARFAPFANGMAEAYGVAIQYEAGVPAGFVTTGYGRVDVDSTTRTDVDLVSFRVKPNGEFDSTWGAAGAYVQDLSGAEDRGRYTLALPDNRVLMVGGGVITGTNKDAMLVLLEKNGAVATNFDPVGQKLYDFGGANDEFYAAALSKDGQWIAAVGYAGATAGGLTNGNSTLVILPVGR